jgi:Flp pilus assembly pilin Flp
MVKNLNDWMLKTYVKTREDAKNVVDRVIDNQRGSGAVEYALIIGVVVVMVVGATAVMEGPLKTFYGDIIDKIRAAFGM